MKTKKMYASFMFTKYFNYETCLKLPKYNSKCDYKDLCYDTWETSPCNGYLGNKEFTSVTPNPA